jgi:hypothetical protein
MNTYSVFLVIKEMPIKRTLRYHLTPVRMAIINITQVMVKMQGKKETLLIHYWWECKLVQLLWKAIWRFLKNLKIELLWSSSSILGTYVKKCVLALFCRASYTVMFIAALFAVAKLWKQLRCSTSDEWIKKMWYTHTHTSIKKNEIMLFAGKWMEL